MRDTWVVLKWEFKRSVNNKALIITTILIPLIVLGAAFLPQLLSNRNEQHLVVVDDTGQIYPQLVSFLNTQNVKTSREEGIAGEEIKRKAEKDNEKSYLYIPADFFTVKKAYHYYQSSSIVKTNVNFFLDQVVKNYQLKSLGIPEDKIEQFEQSVQIENINVAQKESSNLTEMIINQVGLIVLGFLMVFTSMMTGGILLQSIIKEKNDRVVEILLSSVSSMNLMAGKILGSLLVGLCQMAVFVAIGLGAARFGFGINIARILTPNLLLYLIYGILALIMIYALYAFLGSIMKEVQSGGQAQPMLIILPLVPMWFAGAIITNPTGGLAQSFSYIPTFTPMTMMLRLATTAVPFWEIALTILELVVFDILLVYFVARIFKTGLLMYGKTAGFKEVWRWFRQAN